MANKNQKGAGSFRQLRNNSYEFTVSDGYDIYGNRKRKFFYGKTQTECRKKYKQYLKEGEKQVVSSKEYTVSSWLDQWLKTYKKGNIEDSSYADYVHIASHVQKHKIGDMKLSQVKPLHITEYFASKLHYSYSFTKKSKFLLTSAFECAIDNDFCIKNPVKRAEIAKKVQAEKEAYTEEESRIIINFAKTDELFGVAMYIMFNTGIRGGEMRALTVDRIDFENGVITIDRAIKRTGEIGKTKNGKTRYIPLEPEVTEFLKSRLSGKSGYVVGDDYYVTHSGLRGRYEWFFKRLNLFLESDGEKPIVMKSPHSTRHTFGTLRQKHGMPIAMVSELLGHSSTDVTDKYTHLGDVATLSEAVRKYTFIDKLAE